MFLLLLLARDEVAAKLISTLVRVQGLSYAGLAADSGVQKSALLKFVKRAKGGYLAPVARERVLNVLGWDDGGPSRRRVHTWLIDEIGDAKVLFGLGLSGRAKLSFTQHVYEGGPRVAVGVADEAPFVVSATYHVDTGTDDPMISNSVGSFYPETVLLLNARSIEVLRRSTRSFFEAFGYRPVSAPVDIASSLSQSPAIERLVELGFREDDIDALAEDFLAMQCRIDPQGMHRRLKEQLQAQAILSKSPVELGLDGAIDAHIEHQAAMPPNYKWVS